MDPTFTTLFASACSDAEQSLISRYSGRLLFHDGEFLDERLRSDTVEVDLTRDCLNAALSLNIEDDNLAAVCAALATDSTRCSPAGGLCQCSMQSEKQPAASGPYGVLGTSVVIGLASGASEVDYCVNGDVLHWQEPGSGQHLVLRRE